MQPTATDVLQTINTTQKLILTVQQLITSGRPNLSLFSYTALLVLLRALENYLMQIFMEVAADEIQVVMGNDFITGQLDFDAVVARHELIPSVSALKDDYGVDLTGETATLGEWMSDPASDTNLIIKINDATIASAQRLYDEIQTWDASSGQPGAYTGELYSIDTSNLQPLHQIRTADSPTTAMKLITINNQINLKVAIADTHYAQDETQLFGYLNGWEYAGFARRCIKIDEQIYQATTTINEASRLWNRQNWLPLSSVLLRTNWLALADFEDRNIVSIDPVHSLAQDSPYDLIQAYRARTTECSEAQKNQLCHDSCYDPVVISATDNVPNWQWAGTPRNTNSWLPFLPGSIITGCTPARRTLARGTKALWNEFAIFQTLEYLVRWTNILEHGAYFNQDTPEARQARVDLMQYLHSIYYRTTPTDRMIEYLAALSSAIFEFDNVNKVDHRNYQFLVEVLTPIEDYSFNGVTSRFATESFDIDWANYNTSQYSLRIQNAIVAGATTTFGSDEFNNLNNNNRLLLFQQYEQSEGWVDFLTSTQNYGSPHDYYDPNNPTIPDVPLGVFLLTIDQLSYVQILLKSQG